MAFLHLGKERQGGVKLLDLRKQHNTMQEPRVEPHEAHMASTNPGFCSKKQLGVLLLNPGWNASPSQGYAQQHVTGPPLYTRLERDNME